MSEGEDTIAHCQFRSLRGIWLYVIVALGLIAAFLLNKGVLAVLCLAILVCVIVVVITKGHIIPLLLCTLMCTFWVFDAVLRIIADGGVVEAIICLFIGLIIAVSTDSLQKRLCRGPKTNRIKEGIK